MSEEDDSYNIKNLLTYLTGHYKHAPLLSSCSLGTGFEQFPGYMDPSHPFHMSYNQRRRPI